GPTEDFGVFFLEADGGEEKLIELFTPAAGEVGGFSERFETGHFGGDDDEAIVALAALAGFPVLFEANDGEGAAFNDDAGISGEVAKDHGVQGIAIGSEGAGDEAPIVGIAE